MTVICGSDCFLDRNIKETHRSLIELFCYIHARLLGLNIRAYLILPLYMKFYTTAKAFFNLPTTRIFASMIIVSHTLHPKRSEIERVTER